VWYQLIAERGYHAGDDTVHFEPLYPLLSHIVSVPLAGHVVPALLIVASSAFAVAMWLLYKLARIDVGAEAAHLTVLLTVFFPVGFFLLAPYTESLYLALTLAAFWFARHNRPWLAGLMGLGAALTRTVAIFMVMPLAYAYVKQRDEEGKTPGLGLLASTFPALGLLGTIGYDRLIVGEHRSVFQVGSQWGDTIVPFWRAVPDSWSHITATGDPVEILNLVALFGFTILALLAVRRLPLMYSLYTLPYLALLFDRESAVSPLESVARYLLVLFPCFMMLALGLARRRGFAAACLLVGISMQVVLLDYSVHFGFVA
ncbi:MAG TPA: hypothetical protein VF898_01915, partial [Chloroflexota bacterium]